MKSTRTGLSWRSSVLRLTFTPSWFTSVTSGTVYFSHVFVYEDLFRSACTGSALIRTDVRSRRIGIIPFVVRCTNDLHRWFFRAAIVLIIAPVRIWQLPAIQFFLDVLILITLHVEKR